MNRPAVAQKADEDSGLLTDSRVVFGGLWLVSFLLQFYASPDWLTESVRVVDPPVDCVLADGIGWSSPLSLVAGDAFAEWPFLIFAPLSAAFLAAVGLHLASVTAGWLVAAFVVGASLSIGSQHFLPAILVFTMVAASRRKLEAEQSPASLRILLGGSLIGVLTTIEFGFVILVALCLLPGVLAVTSNRRRAVLESGGVLVLGLLILGALGSLGDFAAAFLRPVSWLWIPTEAVGMTSTGFALSGESITLPRCLLASFLLSVWVNEFLRAGLTRSISERTSLLPLLAGSLVCLCCGRFFWLGVCSIATVNDRGSSRDSPRWSLQFLAATLAIVAMAEGSALLNDEEGSPLLPMQSTQLVDPAAWEVSGNVLLMDLDQSAAWQSSEMRAKFRLLIDDRWDVFGDQYLEFAAVCRDLFEVRAKSYLRADGNSGGYLLRQKLWSPALLVTDVRQVERVRQLSLSPHWSVLSVDGERTILGRLDDPQIQPQRQRAGSTLVTLEWPVRPLDAIDSVLVAGDDEDLRRVAAVLAAIRLPYAALRTLPDDDTWPTQKIRAWCYLELAHRTRRHSGRIALLDQYRALALVRKIHAAGKWNVQELLRIVRSLEGLKQFEYAVELATELESESAKFSVSSLQRKQLLAARGRIKRRWQKTQSSQTPATGNEAEVRLREALATGSTDSAKKRLADLNVELRPIFAVLVSTSSENTEPQNAGELTSELLDVLDPDKSSPTGRIRQADSARLRSEFFFVLGSVALEAGQTGIAAEAFAESARLAPQSPLQNIRQMHLQRLATK